MATESKKEMKVSCAICGREIDLSSASETIRFVNGKPICGSCYATLTNLDKQQPSQQQQHADIL
ncbi:MAG: hypothetical protein QXH07_07130 [Thermoplasmata archaeon]